MSQVMDEEIKRWTARRKSALVLEIIQGKKTVAEASRQFDLPPSEIESWLDDGKRGMENALRAKPEDVREQYERQLKDLQEAYGEAMLECVPEKIELTAGQGRDLMVARPRAEIVPAALGQRPGVHQQKLHTPGAQLRPATGIHHPA